MEQEAEQGAFLLDFENLGQAYLQEDAPGDVLDNIVATFVNLEDVTEVRLAFLLRLG